MSQEYDIKCQHFAGLKDKYQAGDYEDSSPVSPLYFILRKADLGVEIHDLEYIWLQKEKLLNTANLIRNEQKQKSKEKIKLREEFTKLKAKYEVTDASIEWTVTPLYFILCKIKSGDVLTEKEFNWLISNGFSKINTFAVETRKFVNLKSKYQASAYQDFHPDSPLYCILKKIDVTERLTESEYKWLQENQLLETLNFVKQQEAVRRNEFVELKEKYQAIKYKSNSVGSQLYLILKKLASQASLIDTEIAWLQEQELIETIAIAEEQEKTREFAALKIKYQATDFEDTSPKCHLYKILKKIDSGNFLGEQDVNYLKKRKFNKTIEIANQEYAGKLKSKVNSFTLLNDAEIDWLKINNYQDIIILIKTKQFTSLKSKYRVSEYEDKSFTSPLYSILQKLEKGERIEPKDVAWLQETKINTPQNKSYEYYNRETDKNNQGRALFSGLIWTKYHSIEADFYQQEFKRTGNSWNLVNASSHLRKADKSELALQLTNNLQLNNIKDKKLKSALLTTRGGAFRDIDKLNETESCARQAMKFQPDSHHPYTLMGAICFERHEYSDGEYWFNEAIKRGAKPLDMDSEIKSVLKKSKDEKQRHELVDYLLKKDSKRYAWAKHYLKKEKDKK